MRPKVKCKKPCNIFCYKAFVVLRSQDSNLELPDPESGALPIWPLLNEETNYTIIFLKVITVDEKYPDSELSFPWSPAYQELSHAFRGHSMTTGAEKL